MPTPKTPTLVLTDVGALHPKSGWKDYGRRLCFAGGHLVATAFDDRRKRVLLVVHTLGADDVWRQARVIPVPLDCRVEPGKTSYYLDVKIAGTGVGTVRVSIWHVVRNEARSLAELLGNAERDTSGDREERYSGDLDPTTGQLLASEAEFTVHADSDEFELVRDSTVRTYRGSVVVRRGGVPLLELRGEKKKEFIGDMYATSGPWLALGSARPKGLLHVLRVGPTGVERAPVEQGA